MATATKTRPLKKVSSNGFSFQDYALNTLDQIQNNIKDLRNEIRDLRSETKTDIRDLRTNITRLDGKMDALQRWVVMAAITLFLGLLTLMTFFYNKLDTKIDKNTQAIHNIDKKLDRLEIEIKSEFKEILERLPKR